MVDGSVHHSMVEVVLELEEVRGWITDDERLVHLDTPFEAKTDVAVERHVALLAQMIERVEVRLFAKRDAEMSRVHRQLIHWYNFFRGGTQMAHQLISEEV